MVKDFLRSQDRKPYGFDYLPKEERVTSICTNCGSIQGFTGSKKMPKNTKIIRYVCYMCFRSAPLLHDVEYFDKFGNLIISSPYFY